MRGRAWLRPTNVACCIASTASYLRCGGARPALLPGRHKCEVLFARPGRRTSQGRFSEPRQAYLNFSITSFWLQGEDMKILGNALSLLLAVAACFVPFLLLELGRS